MAIKRLDLAEYQSEGAKIFAGRQRGSFVRNAAQIASLSDSKDELEVLVPEGTYVVTSSFFLALFGQTIRDLGAEEFRRRVHFSGRNIARVVEQSIYEAIEAAKPFVIQ